MLSRFVSTSRASGRDESPRFGLIAYKLTADALSRGVTLLVFVVAARQLRPDELGVMALAMTAGWLLSVASDAGLPLDLARTVARHAAAGTLRPAIVTDAMQWRGWLAVTAIGAGAVVGAWLAPAPLFLAFLFIVIAQVVTAALETVAHAFRGLGRSDIEASLMLLQRAATGVGACGMLLWRPSLIALSVSMVVPPAIALAAALIIARELMRGTTGRQRADAGLGHRFVRDVAPMGLGIFLSALYFRCDVFFIERWYGLETVGIYNAAFRSVEALRLVPAAFMAVVFPSFCTARTLAPLTTAVGWLLAAVVVPALTLMVAPASILELVYGPSFAVAAPALMVLGLALPLFFVNYALTHQVIAWDGQRAYLAIVVAALATSAIGNLLLVPTNGMRGAAMATVITELVVAAGCVASLAVQADRVRRDAISGSARVVDERRLSSAAIRGGPA
jgi:O-antigen/teichoic acid export membrane protein